MTDIFDKSHKELDRLLILKKLSYVNILKHYGFLSMLQYLKFYLRSILSDVFVLTPPSVSESVLIDEDVRISKLRQLGCKIRRVYISDNPSVIASTMMRLSHQGFL